MDSKTNKNEIWAIIAIVASILVVAALGSLFVNLGISWYDTLKTPSTYVPRAVFPIVWTIIYVAFAVILSIWVTKSSLPKSTLALLIANGILNILWCLVYFTLRQTLLGLLVIILNLAVGILLICNVYCVKKIYAYVLSIYPLWLCLATSLNLATWILN